MAKHLLTAWDSGGTFYYQFWGSTHYPTLQQNILHLEITAESVGETHPKPTDSEYLGVTNQKPTFL